MIIMTYSDNKSFLLKTPSETSWHFFLSDEHTIIYRSFKEQAFGPPSTLNLQHIKDFEAAIDPEGIIHLLALTQADQLIYCRWDGLKWQYQTVEHNRYRTQIIPNFSILASHALTHIVYCIKSLSRRSSEAIIHYSGKKNEWNGGKVWVYTPERSTSIHSAAVDCDSRLHLLFSQKNANDYLLRYSLFSPDSHEWSKPVNVYKCGYNYPDCNLFVHGDGQMHIVWKEQENNQYSIVYLSFTDASSSSTGFHPVKTLYKGQAEPIRPVVVLGGNLYCLWEMNGGIHYVVSKDMGNTWSAPQTLPGNKSRPPVFFTYTSFDKPGIPPSIKLWSSDYMIIPDIIDVQQVSVKYGTNGNSHAYYPSYNNNTELMDVMDKNLKKLEKRVKSVERQLENIIPTVYALQDQFHQANKSIYYMETMIRRLNFQLEQLYNRSSTYPYVSEKKQERTPAHSDAQPISKLQDVQSTNQKQEDNQNHQDEHTGGSGQSSSDETEQYRLDKAEKIETPQTDGSSINNSRLRPADMVRDDNNTKRISLGNVDIIINPEEDDL